MFRTVILCALGSAAMIPAAAAAHPGHGGGGGEGRGGLMSGTSTGGGSDQGGAAASAGGGLGGIGDVETRSGASASPCPMRASAKSHTATAPISP